MTNLGNTCYTNSVVQCLSHVPEVTHVFLSGAWRGYINEDNALGSGGAMAAAYSQLLRQLWDGSRRWVPSDSFRATITELAPQFQGRMQHDSQEFLSSLLDMLHEDMNQGSALRRSKSGTLYKMAAGEHPAPADRGPVVSTEPGHSAWDAHVRRNTSLITDKFAGQLKCTTRCDSCSHVSTSFDTFHFLPLPVPVVKHSVSLTIIWELPLAVALAAFELSQAEAKLKRLTAKVPVLTKNLQAVKSRARGQPTTLRGKQAASHGESSHGLDAAALSAAAVGPDSAAASAAAGSRSDTDHACDSEEELSRLVSELDLVRKQVVAEKRCREQATLSLQRATKQMKDVRLGRDPPAESARATRSQRRQRARAQSPASSAAWRNWKLFDAEIVPVSSHAVRVDMSVPWDTTADAVLCALREGLKINTSAKAELFSIKGGAPDGCLRGQIPIARLLRGTQGLVCVYPKVEATRPSLRAVGSKEIHHPSQLCTDRSGCVKFQYMPVLHRVQRFSKRIGATAETRRLLDGYGAALEGWGATQGDSGTPTAAPPAAPALDRATPFVSSLHTLGLPYVLRIFPNTTVRDVVAISMLWGKLCWESSGWSASLMHQDTAGAGQESLPPPRPWGCCVPEVSGTDAMGRKPGTVLDATHALLASTGVSAAGHPLLVHEAVTLDWWDSALNERSMAEAQTVAVRAAAKAASSPITSPGEIRQSLVAALKHGTPLESAMTTCVDACADLAEVHAASLRALPSIITPPPLDGFTGTLAVDRVGPGKLVILEEEERREAVDAAFDGAGATEAEHAAELESHPGWVWQDQAGGANVGQDGEVSLAECMASFEREERLSPGSTWTCPECGEATRAWKATKLWRAPQVLCVVLKRFKFDDWGNATKLDSLVRFPVEELHLDAELADSKFSLAAISNHAGTLLGGHYTAFCKNPVSKAWYEFNDHLVTPLVPAKVGRQDEPVEEQLVTPDAYVLVYRRRGPAATEAEQQLMRELVQHVLVEGPCKEDVLSMMPPGSPPSDSEGAACSHA